MPELMVDAGFHVVLHKAEEGGYWGEVPALPGCVSEGDTQEECRENVLDAARGCLECYCAMAMKSLAARTRRRPTRPRVREMA